MVERIEAMPLVVKPAYKPTGTILPHLQDNPVRQALRVRPSHDGADAHVYGVASVYVVHALTCASTSPCSMSAIAPRE